MKDENKDRKRADQTLASIGAPADFKLLTAPNTWIAYAEATTHYTPHEAGLTNTHVGI